MDAADYAAAHMERLDDARLRSRPRLVSRTDAGTDCLDRGEDIPAARRAAIPGCRFCVDCQEETDRRCA